MPNNITPNRTNNIIFFLNPIQIKIKEKIYTIAAIPKLNLSF